MKKLLLLGALSIGLLAGCDSHTHNTTHTTVHHVYHPPVVHHTVTHHVVVHHH